MKDRVIYDLETMAREVINLCDPQPENIHGTLVAALRDAYSMGSAGISYSELRDRQERERARARS